MERPVYNSGAKVVNLLRADYFKINVGTEEQRQDLLNQIVINMKENPKPMGMSNAGCWRNNIVYNNADWLYDSVKTLTEDVITFYKETDSAFRELYIDRDKEIDTWTNVNNPGSRNKLHTHRGMSIVGLYYVQAKDTGGLVFYNPANLMADCDPMSPHSSAGIFLPEDGDLIMWPSWVPHEVEVNHSLRQRVNIAFNIKL